MGGYCSYCGMDAPREPPSPKLPLGLLHTKLPGPCLLEREENAYYNYTFLSRPLKITLTSSKDEVDGYITGVHDPCPLDQSKRITIDSKIIYINGKLVEGCETKHDLERTNCNPEPNMFPKSPTRSPQSSMSFSSETSFGSTSTKSFTMNDIGSVNMICTQIDNGPPSKSSNVIEKDIHVRDEIDILTLDTPESNFQNIDEFRTLERVKVITKNKKELTWDSPPTDNREYRCLSASSNSNNEKEQ